MEQVDALSGDQNRRPQIIRAEWNTTLAPVSLLWRTYSAFLSDAEGGGAGDERPGLFGMSECREFG